MESGKTLPPYHWDAVCCLPDHSLRYPHKTPNDRPIGQFQRDMYFPSVAKSISRVTIAFTGSKPSAGSQAAGRFKEGTMHIAVYGSGYLATVISACLADFGTPVCCCHSDGSRITEVAKGDIPFFEKNLQEVIRRNVRSGRLVYSTDPEDLARKAQVIFLAEYSPQGLDELVLRLARAAGRVQVLSIVTPVRVGTTSNLEKALKGH